MSDILKTINQQIIDGHQLDGETMRSAFAEIMEGKATPVQITSFLIGLKMRGETPTDIAAGAAILRAKARHVQVHDGTASEEAMDIVGTGGDGVGTYNISTATALVVAGAGIPVAKHGNKAVSSKSGAADVLTELGVNIDCPFENLETALREAGITFLMAQRHHTAMRHVAPIRAELGVRTIFNLLGPLSNPGLVKRMLIGVYDAHWLQPFAEALRELGITHAWVVHGADGLDELSTTGTNQITALQEGKISSFTLHPSELGIATARIEDIKGGEAQYNAAAMRAMLGGQAGAYRDITLLNAAAALMAGGYETDWQIALSRAQTSIDGGAGLHALERLVQITKGT